MTIEVTSCDMCPFIKMDAGEVDYCGYPNSKVEDREMPNYNEEYIPLKCPLISHSTLIRKADNATIK